MRELKLGFMDRALTIASGTPGEKLWASEPYYQPDENGETSYQGLPRYMDVSRSCIAMGHRYVGVSHRHGDVNHIFMAMCHKCMGVSHNDIYGCESCNPHDWM